MKPSLVTINTLGFRCRLLTFALLLNGLWVSAASAEEDYVYKVTQGDTLIGLSGRLLRRPDDWPKVARHNRLPDANFLLPGEALRIPFALLKGTSAPASVIHVEGDVKAAASAKTEPSLLTLGESLAEGAQVVTGNNGYVTLKLQDGTTVLVQSGTQVQVERMRTYAGVGTLESTIKLIAGRLESLVRRPADKAQTRHTITTPLATLTVRGTVFRVTMDGQSNETRSEVLEGVVAVQGAKAGAATDVKRVSAGLGAVVNASKSVSDPIALLAVPDVARLVKLQERTVLRFPLPPVEGARTYRAQLARDAAFSSVVAEIVSPSPELRIGDMADGSYFLRVRAVDGRGLEGHDATHAFSMKARPEPPLISAPASKGKVRAAEVTFKWAENTDAAAYHLQVSRDAGYKALVHEDQAVKGAQTAVGKLELGEYFWRVASLRKDGDHGPYSDTYSFVLFAPPAQPEPPVLGDTTVRFRWQGEAGQRFEFQMAAEPGFTQPILMQTLDKPEFEVSRPRPGTYYMRFRATDADGFVGPYSSAQVFSIPEIGCLRDSEGHCVYATHGLVVTH